MNENETIMKGRGEARVWKATKKSRGGEKNVSQTQIGQQLLAEESERIAKKLYEWVSYGATAKIRKNIKSLIQSEEDAEEIAFNVQMLLAVKLSLITNKSKVTKPSRMCSARIIHRQLFKEKIDVENTWRVIEQIVDLSKYFDVVLTTTGKKSTNTYKRHLEYVSILPKEITDKLEISAVKAFYPLPMLEPPTSWAWDKENGIEGGYKTHQLPMIRSSLSNNVDYSRYNQNIFDAVNYIQQTAWEVNHDVLGAVEMTLQIPNKDDFIRSEFPEMNPKMEPEIDINCPTLSKKKKQKLIELRKPFYESVDLYQAERKDYESAIGKYRAVVLALEIAKDYVGKVIYFPHNYDTRGRVYPIPVGLTPQGSDAVKAMLQYKEGQVLNESGERWAWAYLASLYGDDKLPFSQRIQRGKELLNEDWQTADEPYQFLAHQLELQEWVNDKSKPVKMRIHLDACNSGSQFTSAITGDKGGCEATNVIPSYSEEGKIIRRDAYTEVASIAEKNSRPTYTEVTSGSINEETSLFNSLLGSYGRKICKTPVMVSNYGGTAQGRSEILFQMMRELKVDRNWINRKTSSNFSKLVGDAIGDTLKGGKKFERYIHQMCLLIAKTNTTVKWTTPDGFVVEHLKNKIAKKVLTLKLTDRQTTVTTIKFLPELNPQKMKSAVAPNYIHSLDAMLLRRVALEMKFEGFEISDWIHDSFGCQPNNVDKMLEITKKEFIKLVRGRPLKVLHEELCYLAERAGVDSEALEKVKLPQLKGFDSQTGLDCVMDSDWFFS